MSSTDVQLRFAAEFSLFLVSLAGIGFAFLRADLLARRPSARWVATVGFFLLGVAAFASGALLIDDPSDGLLVGLRIGGIVLVSLASTAWRTDRGGRELLRIGMVALLVAEVASFADKSASVVDLARMLGALGIGASLLAVSSRVISARIAATGAMLVLAVITVVAVTLSAVISNNIEDDAIRRYEARAKQEASALAATIVPALLPTRLLAAALNSTTDDNVRLALSRVTNPPAGRSDAQLASDAQVVAGAIQSFLELAKDDVERPTLIVRNGARVAVPASLTPAFVTELVGSRVVTEAQRRIGEATSVAVLDNEPYSVAAVPIDPAGRLGTLAVASKINPSYLELRRQALDDEQEDSGLQLATTDLVLLGSGVPNDVGSIGLATSLANTAMNTSQEPVRRTEHDFVIASPVRASDDTPVMAIVLTVPRTQVDETREDLYRNLFLVAMGAATAAMLLAAVAGERIGSGLRKITAAATAIQGGNLDVRTGFKSDDEIGALAASFDAMADSLRLLTGELRLAARDEAELRLRLEAVVAGMGEALVAVDAGGRITAFNAAAEELTDVPGTQARGRLVESVVKLQSEDGASMADRLSRPVLEGWTMGGIVVQDAGREVPVAVSAGTLRDQDGQVNGAVFVLRDVRREHELERMKTEFLATISHELRTPLTPIKGFASILSTRDLPREQTKGFADEITSAADQLERIIGQLVNFATIVGGRLSIDSEAIALRPLVDESIAAWQERAGSSFRFVRKVNARLPRVLADKSYLVQALDELLDNAVKYSPDGGTITVEAKVVDHHGDPSMELSVIDHGVGIAQDRLETILEDFRQGDSSATRRYGGLGLGLALVQRIARAHGGELTVWSSGSNGTRASIVLPLDGPAGGTR
jgi:PAS domain S-box-containing protein